jgi:hypothetical protein
MSIGESVLVFCLCVPFYLIIRNMYVFKIRCILVNTAHKKSMQLIDDWYHGDRSDKEKLNPPNGYFEIYHDWYDSLPSYTQMLFEFYTLNQYLKMYPMP